MKVLRIVEINNGKFAIQARDGWRWKFCSRKEYYIWREAQYIMDYCLVDSLEDAEKSLEAVCKSIKAKRGENFRVVRVWKKVRV